MTLDQFLAEAKAKHAEWVRFKDPVSFDMAPQQYVRDAFPLLLAIVERMRELLECQTPDYPCDKWPCTTPGKPLCDHCQALADVEKMIPEIPR